MEAEKPRRRSPAEPSPSQVTAFLRRVLGEPITGVAPIRHGEWSRAFSFRHGDADYVIRFSAVEADFLKDQRIAGLRSAGFRVPRIVAVGAAQAFGGFYAISERAPGGYLDELDAAGIRSGQPSSTAESR